jgi:V8-like Glu-specific endopeptidase
MEKKKSDSKKTSVLKQAEKKDKEIVETPRLARSLDPFFVPHFKDFKLANSEAGLFDFKNVEQADLQTGFLREVCGGRDFQHVEQYDGSLGVTIAFVNEHQSPVCRIQWKEDLSSFDGAEELEGLGWGTGTMISDNLLLTAGHLFEQKGGDWNRPRVRGTNRIITPSEIARNMQVNFNYQLDSRGNQRQEQTFPILELIEHNKGGLDMAICRIGGNPGTTFRHALLSTTDAVPPEMLCIIGHPGGFFKRIEAGPATIIRGNFIRYNDIDTLGGSSGSGILRARDGRLVGIHTTSGCTIASPSDGNSNSGHPITSLIRVSPTLQALLTP